MNSEKEKDNLSVSHEGLELIRRWKAATKRLVEAKRELSSAECGLTNCTNDLGRWMVPKPRTGEAMPIDEQFNIWLENGLLAAKQVDQNDFKVWWRREPVTEGRAF